ncbi:MAG: rhodanese-like domain-containing protein [Clostridia bacterium]|nr:rhodanese-like domain-containing protein [Clostridia bacterium]
MDINENAKVLLAKPGSVNWPLERITPFDMEDGPIGACCHSGSRSARAAAHLLQNGCDDLVDLGGIIVWTRPPER